MRTLIMLALGMTLAALLAGCSPPQNPIVGKWVSTTNSARTIEFYGDGTFHSDHGNGSYKFPDAAHIVLVPEAGDLFSSLKSIRVDDSTLVFTGTACRAKPASEILRRLPD